MRYQKLILVEILLDTLFRYLITIPILGIDTHSYTKVSIPVMPDINNSNIGCLVLEPHPQGKPKKLQTSQRVHFKGHSNKI